MNQKIKKDQGKTNKQANAIIKRKMLDILDASKL